MYEYVSEFVTDLLHALMAYPIWYIFWISIIIEMHR